MSRLDTLKKQYGHVAPETKPVKQQSADIIQIPTELAKMFAGVASNLNVDLMPYDDTEDKLEILEQMIEPIFPDYRRNKQPASTIENLRALITYMQATVRFNQLSRRVEISLPGFKATTDNAEEIAIAIITSEAARWELPESTVDKFLLVEADRNAYNPIRDFILSRPWDGTKRLKAYSDCLVTTTPEIAEIGVRKMMLGVVAGNFNANGVGDPPPVLTLAGPQGAGKTTFFRNALPNYIDRGFLEGMTFDPSNKDCVMEGTTHGIVEFGELDATFKKAEIARLKAFLTRHRDTYREPYGKRDITRGRRTVYVATVNDLRFLVDRTGNRRFLGVEVSDVKFFHDDIQQVWAEVYHLWQGGERHALTRDEAKMIDVHNLQFTQHDEVHDLVSEKLKWLAYDSETAKAFTYRTATDVALLVGLHADKSITNRVATAVRKLQVEHGIPDDQRRDRKDRYLVPISCK